MITYRMFTNQGERDNNEDYIDAERNGNDHFFVLCDGLGGHGKGEEASRIAVESAIHFMINEENNSLSLEELISKAIQCGQDAVLAAQKSDRSLGDMKTTIVVAAIRNNQMQWGHVGDSRLYHFVGGKYVRRTLDHSVPQMLVRAKEIKEKDIRKHPDRNRLLRVVGNPWDSPCYEISDAYPVSSKKRQALLLCTDGFWELIDEKEMCKTLKAAKTVDEWIEKMADIVKKKGTGTNMDNYSAIGVFIDE